jgi:hypothetical protein
MIAIAPFKIQEVALNGGHDCIEAAKKVGSGKKVRQDIDPAL